MDSWGLIFTGIGIVGTTVGITKVMLDSAVKTIKEHCGDQRKTCSDNSKELWARVNTHGHKALEGNGAKVTI